MRKNNCIINFDSKNKNKICTFTGSILDTIIGLLWLLNKYSNTCSTLRKNFNKSLDYKSFIKI